MRTDLRAMAVWLLVLMCTLPGCKAPEVVQGEAAEAAPAVAVVDSTSIEYGKWQTYNPGEYGDYNPRNNLVQRGLDVYEKYCIGCHGEFGDGRGVANARLLTRPRDFTSGVYKFRSTDSGSLPLEADLHRTITRGLARVSMPSFSLMPENEKLAVIEYIKAFYPGWEAEKDNRVVVEAPRAPADLADTRRIQRGQVVYLEMQCSQCHGIDGQGKGATQTEYVDAWGDAQKPFNFTRGQLKGGDTAQDIYRTFHTGLRSIMPAYGGDTMAAVAQESFLARAETTLDATELRQLTGVLEDFPVQASQVFDEMTTSDRDQLAIRNSWDLVAYIQSLRQTGTTADAVLGHKSFSQELGE